MSIFKKVEAEFYVDSPMYEVGNLKFAAKLDIATRLLQWDDEFQGLVLAYQNIAPATKTQYVYADAPYSHQKMKGEFLIFKPYVGCQLPATVTYVSSSAVSLTIFDYFQGIIDIGVHRQNWDFKKDKWFKGTEPISEGDVVIVEVTDVQPSSEGLVLYVNILHKSKLPKKEIYENEEFE